MRFRKQMFWPPCFGCHVGANEFQDGRIFIGRDECSSSKVLHINNYLSHVKVFCLNQSRFSSPIPRRPATSFFFLTSPWKSFKYIIWKNYKWYIIGILLLLLLIVIIVLFLWSMPVSLFFLIALSTDSKNRSLQSFMESLCGQTTHDTLALIALSTDSKNRSLQSFMESLCGQTTHDTLACNCNNRIVDLEKQKKGIALERAFRK